MHEKLSNSAGILYKWGQMVHHRSSQCRVGNQIELLGILQKNSKYVSNVVCKYVICHLLIWPNFEIWCTNIWYCLLSAHQNQFKTEIKRVWLINVFCRRFIFSVKKKENKYSYRGSPLSTNSHSTIPAIARFQIVLNSMDSSM